MSFPEPGQVNTATQSTVVATSGSGSMAVSKTPDGFSWTVQIVGSTGADRLVSRVSGGGDVDGDGYDDVLLASPNGGPTNGGITWVVYGDDFRADATSSGTTRVWNIDPRWFTYFTS